MVNTVKYSTLVKLSGSTDLNDSLITLMVKADYFTKCWTFYLILMELNAGTASFLKSSTVLRLSRNLVSSDSEGLLLYLQEITKPKALCNIL
jgi:hypothetical protein